MSVGSQKWFEVTREEIEFLSKEMLGKFTIEFSLIYDSGRMYINSDEYNVAWIDLIKARRVQQNRSIAQG